jgi:hypothetical protein
MVFILFICCNINLKSRVTLVIAVAFIILISLVSLAYFYRPSFNEKTQVEYCASPIGNNTSSRTNLQVISSGFVFKYLLPPGRYPNGIISGEDGSLWFGEEGLPGIAHLFMNGTLIEYKFPGTYQKDRLSGQCTIKTEIWSLALWNKSIVAGDTSKNRILALNLESQNFSVYQIPSNNSFPFYMEDGKDGKLWFTELLSSKISFLDTKGNILEYKIPTGIRGTPTQIISLNPYSLLYSDAGQAGTFNGGIFYFFPGNSSFSRFVPINSTGITSFAYAYPLVWVSLHGPSYLEVYNFSNNELLAFPTSDVNYSKTSLPYFVIGNGEKIWFNEHYANRVSMIDTDSFEMVEYSISSPPARNINSIDNALTIALAGRYVCFTELTSDAVGCIDTSIDPGISLMADTKRVSLSSGSSAKINLRIQNKTDVEFGWSVAAPFKFSKEWFNLSMVAFLKNGTVSFQINSRDGVKPGDYVLALTFGNDKVWVSKFVILDVS